MSKPFKRALVILSGGQDSTACLFLAAQEAEEVLAVTFDYGQRHMRELSAAQDVYKIAETLAPAAMLSHEIIPLPGALVSASPLTQHATPVEKYANAEVLPGGIEKTFVPMRNALFLVIAYNRAIAHRCDVVYLGVSQEDYGGYPDCRQEFLVAMEKACRSAVAESAPLPMLRYPLLYMTKKHTVIIGNALAGCMQALAHSHTCYNGEYPPCGSCHACLLRAKGFAEAGITDPLIARAGGELR